MANPKCGTCRFFQENDLPGSGWCHHPQRKVSSDVKILVRRSELACRDDWSRSLWQPATGDPASDLRGARPAPSGPLLPASPESLRAMLNRDLTLAAASGEDVLLSEGRIVSESSETWEAPARPFPGGSFDPRTAIFKAREAYREKNRVNAMAARRSAEAVASAFDQERADEIRDERLGEPASAPSNDKEALPIERGALRDSGAEWTAAAEVALVASTAASMSDRVEESELDGESAFWDLQLGNVDSNIDPAQGTTTPLQPEVCEPEDLDAAHDAAPFGGEQQALAPTGLPAWFRADLPRVCRACRDFRPGIDGQRGWCANAWAFTHRQLVREDDAAPCNSAIGDWWVPVDDVWLVAADVSSHGRPTPLLDRMVGDESGQRRRS